jgi:transcriptional antiterminator RfaH
MKRWYVAHTHVNAEDRAETHLTRQGFDVYVPRYRRRRSHARRVTWAPAALFPRYIFVAMDLDAERWRAVLSTVGVGHLVMQGDTPAAVPEGVVEALRAHETDDGVIDFSTALTPGETVRITEGPFADRIGLLAALDGPDRVIVLLDVLGRETKVRLPGVHLQPAA